MKKMIKEKEVKSVALYMTMSFFLFFEKLLLFTF